jgi:hypothetical protein
MNKSTSLLLSLTLGLAVAAPAADAGQRDRSERSKPPHTAKRDVEREQTENSNRTTVTRTHADGSTSSRITDTMKTESGYVRMTSGTTAEGDNWARTAGVNADKETGTLTKEVNGIKADGSAYSRSMEAQRTEDGATRTHTVTAADGTVHTRTVSISRDENGKPVREVSSDPRTVQREQVNEDTQETTVVINTPDGGQAVRATGVSKLDEGYMVQTYVESPDGEQHVNTKIIQADKETGEVYRATSNYNVDGSISARESSLTKTDDGFVRTKSKTTMDSQGNVDYKSRTVTVSRDENGKPVREVTGDTPAAPQGSDK